MKQELKEITINGKEYVLKGTASVLAEKLEGMEYCIVRTYSAGVFAGYIECRDGQEVALRKSRRIWHWSGAASLSQLATDGTSEPDECKFPCEVDRETVLQAIEIIACTEKARKSIQEVPIWES